MPDSLTGHKFRQLVIDLCKVDESGRYPKLFSLHLVRGGPPKLKRNNFPDKPRQVLYLHLHDSRKPKLGSDDRGEDTLVLATTEPGNLFLARGDFNTHSLLWEEHQPGDQRGELVEDWLLSQNASILNDGTATCVNRGADGLSTPVRNAWSTGTEWMVGEDLDSDHLPIDNTEVSAASASHRKAR